MIVTRPSLTTYLHECPPRILCSGLLTLAPQSVEDAAHVRSLLEAELDAVDSTADHCRGTHARHSKAERN